MLQEKKRELERAIGVNKEVKKQLDYIKKTFASDSNYEWMNETENTMKSDKKTLLKIKEDNSSLHKLLEKHEKLLQESEEA